MSVDLQGLIIAIVLVAILGPQVVLVICRMVEIEESKEEESGSEKAGMEVAEAE